MAIAAKIFSTLGNSQSLVPLAVKDCANGAGMTAASSVTSKDEGRDRFIDEFGSEAIWLGGIPTFKKAIDKTLFKAAGLDPNYDVRNLKDKDIFEKTKKYAPNDKIKSNIEKIGQNQRTFKNLNIAKFSLATLMTLGTYNVMTDLKQKYTHNRIKSKLLKQSQENVKAMNDKFLASDSVKAGMNSNFKSLEKIRTGAVDNKNGQEGQPNFKGLYNVMLDPVKNTMVLDGGITTERLAKSRSPQELAGYAIKEGGFLFFMYVLGQKIQSHLEKSADKKHNKNISLDARVLENDSLKQAFADKSIEKSLNDFEKFTNPNVKDADLYEFLHNYPDNMVVDAAKQSDIIKTYKKPKKWYQIFKKSEDTGIIDSRKYINMDSVKNTYKNMSKLYNQYKTSGETADKFFNGVRKLKRGSIMKNIGSTIFALGVFLPGVMLADRFLKPDNKEFAVEKEIKAQLAKENKIV